MRNFTIGLIAAGFLLLNLPVYGVDVSGKAYIQYSYDLSDDADDKNAFDVTRVYLNFNEEVTDTIKFKATTDVKRIGGTQSDSGYLQAFLKYAYLDFADVCPWAESSSLKVGQVPTPWTGFEDKIWGYRYISKSFADLEGKLSSADLGLNFEGKYLGGRLEKNLALINGEGYHNAEVNKYKDAQLRLTWKPWLTSSGSETLKGVGLSGFYSAGIDENEDTRNRGVVLLSLQNACCTVAVEYLSSTDGGTDGSGFGGFGSVKIGDKRTLFARVENFDPDTDTDDDEHTRYILGVNQELADKVDLALDYQGVNYEASGSEDGSGVYLHMRVKY